MDGQKPVAFIQLRCGNRSLGNVKFRTLHLFDKSSLRHEDQPHVDNVGKRNHINVELILRIIVAEIVDRCPLVAELAMRNILDSEEMLPANVRVDTEFRIAHRMQDDPVLGIRRFPVLLIYRLVHCPGIPEPVHQEDTRIGLCLLLLDHNRAGIRDDRPARAGVSFLVGQKFRDDHIRHGVIAVQNIGVRCDILQRLVIVRLERVQLETDQSVELHLQDRVRLRLRKMQLRSRLL